jgi:hypothetical protein
MKRPRLSRRGYWVSGAAIALAGALAARALADAVGESYRIAIWLSGVAVIFVGLAVVSLGTRAHLGEKGEDGAGEGNRTLA